MLETMGVYLEKLSQQPSEPYSVESDRSLLFELLKTSLDYSKIATDEKEKKSVSDEIVEKLYRLALSRSGHKKFEILKDCYEVVEKICLSLGGEPDDVMDIKILYQFHKPGEAFYTFLDSKYKRHSKGKIRT